MVAHDGGHLLDVQVASQPPHFHWNFKIADEWKPEPAPTAQVSMCQWDAGASSVATAGIGLTLIL